jgi:hypothetical protein
MIEILELERKNNAQALEQKIKKMKYEKQQALNSLCINIITAQITNQTVAAMFSGIDN